MSEQPMRPLPQDSVNYRLATGPRRCASCARFRSEQQLCMLVTGTIRAEAVCDEWAPW